MQGYLYLLLSIGFEIFGTSMLKLSSGFTNVIPSIILIISFGIAFIFLLFSLKTLPLSKAYSIWAALGTVGTTLIGALFFNEILSVVNVIGIVVVITGVVIMNLDFTNKSINHN